ncbi:hypothetical protein IFM89_022366 [Coptis chinensis]|uniref:Uncharacterized protein n=1 Tax=Coptis chinensis TaxID=261450 RepID=A0A835GYL4_9MAGN|nr:hypothetical protein IFM89_022366 [Coptis chinensis]
MVGLGVKPDKFTYSSVFKACGYELDLSFGKEVHKCIEGSYFFLVKDGIILGADTRATEGPIVVDKNYMVTSQILELHRRAIAVSPGYQGHVSAALVLGGVDITGPHLHNIYPHGSTDTLPYATMGSGSLAAMAMFESNYKEGLSEALRSRTAFAAGKAFFITNLDPMKLWDFVSLLFGGLGYPRPRFKVPAKWFLFVAVISNWLHEKLEQRDAHSVLTPIVHQLSCSMTFNCSEARNHIGYSPIVSL